jgi:lactoylglutathione lyase
MSVNAFNLNGGKPAAEHPNTFGEDFMKFRFDHNSINVLDLEKSLNFYREALGLIETRQIEPADKRFKLVFLGDGKTSHKLELTWLRERTESYSLGDNEFHLALIVDDYDAAYKRHKEMGCICYENPTMGIYFIEDPDGFWVEIIPEKK